MRTRDKKMSDYGVSKEREKELIIFCRNNENEELVKEAARMANPFIDRYIFANLIYGIGYNRLTRQYFIPLPQNDFYGYRRRTLGLLNQLLNKEVDCQSAKNVVC